MKKNDYINTFRMKNHFINEYMKSSSDNEINDDNINEENFSLNLNDTNMDMINRKEEKNRFYTRDYSSSDTSNYYPIHSHDDNYYDSYHNVNTYNLHRKKYHYKPFENIKKFKKQKSVFLSSKKV